MLSVYTLTVITVERFYAISNAMQLNKRIGLKQAGSNSKDPIIVHVSINISKMKIAKENWIYTKFSIVNILLIQE